MNRVEEVEEFLRKLAEFPDDKYPPELVPVPVDKHFNRGTAFFSGGLGLIDDPAEGFPPFPIGGVMFVGNTLDAEEPYLKRHADGFAHGDRRRPMPTWRWLYELIERANLPERCCFFTNILVGLVKGNSAMGLRPRPRDQDWCEFEDWCRPFVEHQIHVMKPSIIVLLGKPAREFFGLDDASVDRAPFAGHPAAYTCLRHPSMWPANLKGVVVDGLTGIAAQLQLVQKALAIANFRGGPCETALALVGDKSKLR